MRFTVKSKKLWFGLFFLMVSFIWISRLRSVGSQGRDDKKSRSPILSKPMNDVAARASFEWIDEKMGVGKAIVVMEGRTFREDQSWSFEWNLPSGSTTASSVRGTFDPLILNQHKQMEIEVSGLNPNSNQNIFLKLTAISGPPGHLTVVVPTRFEDTMEAKVASQFRKKIQTKTMGQQSGIPKGIYF